MNQPTICPSCGSENPPNALVCTRCKAPLVSLAPSRITQLVPNSSLGVTSIRRTFLGHLPSNVIGIQISTRDEPFLIQVETDLLLGRDSQTGVPPLFDLTPYAGALLGISRQHTLISRTETGYAVKDLGSTNGTWLNSIRLTPHQFYDLANGDQLRMAQLTLYIFIASGERLVENRFCLRGGTADLAMTPDHLVNIIGPYLRTIAALQTVIDDLMERKSAGSFVLSISTETASICIKMTGISEALNIIETIVTEGRKRFRTSSTTRHISQESFSDFERKLEKLAPESLSMLPEQEQMLTELAVEVIKRIAPKVDPTSIDGKAFSTRLMPNLRVLVFSALSIAHEQQHDTP